jgi:hypothetical protein
LPDPWSGSYAQGDVEFLLKPVELEYTSTLEREREVQAGRKHYSEMVGRENPPSQAYLETFERAWLRNGDRMAQDLLVLANQLRLAFPQGLTLVSLARGGTPIGVLLRRALQCFYGVEAPHYSISILRGRGMDFEALKWIRAQGHEAQSVVFVDGWTGKGAVAQTLQAALDQWNQQEPDWVLRPQLAVLTDLAGVATWTAGVQDYLLPSSLLNGTISGLISRTVCHERWVGPQDFHACGILHDLAPWDCSAAFVDEITQRMNRLELPTAQEDDSQAWAAARGAEFLAWVASEFGEQDPLRVKPGLGESTRALLRRVSGRLLLRSLGDPDAAHLELLAAQKGVPVTLCPEMPYQAAVLIRTLGDG